MEELFATIKNNGGVIFTFIALCGIFVEISPIKINPLSSLIRWVGNYFNAKTRYQLTLMSSQLNDISVRIDMLEINDMRSKILDFSNSCMNERKHTREEFDHIIDLHNQYEKTIESKGTKNGRVDLAFSYISDLYTKCLNENSFLDSRSNL